MPHAERLCFWMRCLQDKMSVTHKRMETIVDCTVILVQVCTGSFTPDMTDCCRCKAANILKFINLLFIVSIN